MCTIVHAPPNHVHQTPQKPVSQEHDQKTTAMQGSLDELQRQLQMAKAEVNRLQASNELVQAEINGHIAASSTTKEQRNGYRARCAVLESM